LDLLGAPGIVPLRILFEMPRVLIIKPSSLGDIIHALQVAQSLRAQSPDTQVDWVAAKAFAPLVRASTAIEHVYEFDRHGSTLAFARLAKEIRREKYDWAFDMQGLARSALLLAAARATHKAGRADGREGATLLARRKPALPPEGKHAHALDILLQFLPLMGLKAELSGAPLEFLATEHPVLPPDLAARRPIVMFPDSRVKKKEWPGFFELTEHLLKTRPDIPIVWAGSMGPEPELHWSEAKFVNLLGRTRLNELPEVISAARLVICNDSGPMHLAAAMHQPVVALFGPTDHGRFGPYPLDNPRHTVIRAPDGKMAKLSTNIVLMNVEKALKEIIG
jgi:heptosyltransferase-1